MPMWFLLFVVIILFFVLVRYVTFNRKHVNITESVIHETHELQETHEPYKTLGPFGIDTLPSGLKARHNTRVGVWGEIKCIEGQMILHFEDGIKPSVQLPMGKSVIVKPQEYHRVELLGESTRMLVSFWRLKMD
jgi:cupin 2 domain-containing protein